jgi:hypothetical protein
MSLLNQFRVLKDGTGVITPLANGSLLRISASGSDGARLYRSFPALPGVTYTMVTNARLVSGSGGTVPFIGVDYPTEGTLVNRTDLNDDFSEHVVTYTVPYSADATSERVIFAMGIFGGTDGTVEVSNTRFYSDKPVTQWHTRYSSSQLYNAAGGASVPATADIDIVREGNTVTITGTINPSSTVSASTIQTEIDLIPEWAKPIRKSVVVSGFSTGGSYLTMTSVFDTEQQQIKLFKREINTTLSDLDFGSGTEYFSITYNCQSELD